MRNDLAAYAVATGLPIFLHFRRSSRFACVVRFITRFSVLAEASKGSNKSNWEMQM